MTANFLATAAGHSVTFTLANKRRIRLLTQDTAGDFSNETITLDAGTWTLPSDPASCVYVCVLDVGAA